MPPASRGGQGLLQAGRQATLNTADATADGLAPVSWYRAGQGRSHEGTHRVRQTGSRGRRRGSSGEGGGRWGCSLSPGQGTPGQKHLRHWGSGVPLSLPGGGGPDLSRPWGAHRAFSGGPHCRRVSGDTPQGLASGPRWLTAQLTGSSPTPSRSESAAATGPASTKEGVDPGSRRGCGQVCWETGLGVALASLPFPSHPSCKERSRGVGLPSVPRPEPPGVFRNCRQQCPSAKPTEHREASPHIPAESRCSGHSCMEKP